MGQKEIHSSFFCHRKIFFFAAKTNPYLSNSTESDFSMSVAERNAFNPLDFGTLGKIHEGGRCIEIEISVQRLGVLQILAEDFKSTGS